MNVTNIDTPDLNWNAATPCGFGGTDGADHSGPAGWYRRGRCRMPGRGVRFRIELSEGVYVETSHVNVIPALSTLSAA